MVSSARPSPKDPSLPSPHSSLLPLARHLSDRRDTLAAEWSARLGERVTVSPTIPREQVERELRVLIAALAEMLGPFRREVKPTWLRAADHYGRVAFARGLAAGELVDECALLRDLLVHLLAPVVAEMRPRRALGALLRINHDLDEAIAAAVVGYTELLVASLFAHAGRAGHAVERDSLDEAADLARQLDAISQALTAITSRT